MHDKGLIKSLIQLAKITPQDLVVDIGAGTGALTLPLAAKAKQVIAVEYDALLIEKLKRKMGSEFNIRLIQGDFLQVPLPKHPFCVVSNIPYAITTPIMGKLLDRPNTPLQRAVLVMEKGAAKRFTATPITNPRILKWRMWFDMRLERTVAPTHFSPPPRVDSAVLSIWRKKEPLISLRHHALFMALAEYGLKYPYLPLYEALKGIFTASQLKHLLRNLGLHRDDAICLLNEDQWATLFQTMIQYVRPFRWPKPKR